MVSNNIVDQLLVSMPSCEVTSDDFSKGFVAMDNSGADDLVVAFSSISLVESSGQSEDVGKENVRVHDGFQVRGSSTICALPRRVSPRSKSNLKAGTKKAGQSCKKSRKPFLDFTTLTVTKKRRSCLKNRVRSCPWGIGFMGKVNQAFLKSTALDFNFNSPIKLPRPRNDRVKRKGIKNQVAQNSQAQKETTCVPTRRIRLKVKVGREVSQQSLKDVTPITESNDESYLRTAVETPETETKNNLEELPRSIGLQGCKGNLEDAPVSNYAAVSMHLSNKDTSQKLARKIEDSYREIRALQDVERLGITLDSRCLDPGTSPDSEVINVTPETQMSGIVLETKQDVLDSSMPCPSHTDVASISMRQRSKKGKKKGKFYKAGNCSVEGGLPGLELMGKATVTEKYEHGEKMVDGSHSSDSSIFGKILNASSNAFISEEFSGEQKLFSRATNAGISCEPFAVDKVAVVDACFGSDVKSVKSDISDKMDSFLNSMGKKLPKSARARGVRKSTSEGPDSSVRRRNACRQKGNGSKSGSNRKAKGKDDGNLDVCKVDRQTGKGDHTLDGLGEIKSGERGAARDSSNSYLVPNEAGKQHLLPRNAWVRCDDCHKWRRITAELADHIEETNCKWVCKDNLDKEFAKCSIPQEKSNAEINAELEISDVSCEEDAGDAHVNSRNSGLKHLSVAQHTWRLISSNVFLHRSRKNQNIDEIMVCHCKPPSDGRMGCGDGCLNRMLNIECDRETCPCGDLCSNQQFQKRRYAPLQPFRCGKKGYGLQLLEDIPKGQFLIEYVGEVLDMHAYEARQRDYALNGHKHFYFMTLNGSEVIDACAKGNLGRFINHSCDPNCQTEKWMVNGEVCIGLFAVRDIKKGEEVTFDYNFVRVFGAAVKKCVCGASQCRGYIGGDPLNSEVIVQVDSDDEYPEPIMINEDGEINNNLENALSVTSASQGKCLETTASQPKNQDNMEERDASFGCLETKTGLVAAEILLEEVGLDNPPTAIGHAVIKRENEDSMKNVTSSASKMEVSLETESSMEQLPSFIEPIEPSLQPAVVSSKSLSSSEQGLQLKEETMNDSVCSTQKSEASSQTTVFGNSLPDLTKIKRKSKSETEESSDIFQKSSLLMKSSSSSSSVKKGKSRTKVANVRKSLETENKSHVLPCKFKKPLDGSSNGRFEEVEEKLSELLDKDGGINRRKDASRGYLKLLLLTAASGDSIHGETIQRTRDLSMILDALLKTKSRTILIDIINKNGLQMLHNIMKRCRREFNKIPVLRKLLKVLEYLAVRQILNQEQINGGPQRPGVESFRESILRLTEHVDKQVHQIARSFRDQWIPRHLRKINWMGRDDGWMELEQGSNCNRLSAWSDQAARPTETIDNVQRPVPATAPDETCTANGCSASGSMGGCLITGTKTRKRKSRWDQPAETTPDPRSPQLKEPRTDDGRPNINEDFPPGFSTPCNGSLFLSSASPCVNHSHQENVLRANCSCQVVIAHPQGRFVSRLPVSYGIPVSIVQQFGIQEAETVNWVVAPGLPFHPFPPLPLYPRDRKDTKNSAANRMRQPAERLEPDYRNFPYRSDRNPASTLGAGPSNIEMLDTSNRNNFQRGRSFSGGLGKKYFRQQKWNHSKLAPPWVRNRNGWGSLNNSLRNGMCNTGVENGINEFEVPYGSEGARTSVETPGNPFY